VSTCGTYSAYVQGCRCKPCKKANASYQTKYRSSEDKRKAAVLHAKRHNRAAVLALRYLREHDKKAYYKCMDEAKEWMNQPSVLLGSTAPVE
jgi:hypothetical protein